MLTNNRKLGNVRQQVLNVIIVVHRDWIRFRGGKWYIVLFSMCEFSYNENGTNMTFMSIWWLLPLMLMIRLWLLSHLKRNQKCDNCLWSQSRALFSIYRFFKSSPSIILIVNMIAFSSPIDWCKKIRNPSAPSWVISFLSIYIQVGKSNVVGRKKTHFYHGTERRMQEVEFW